MRAACESFSISKDAGYKIVAHMMPDLPNVGIERDLEQFLVSISFIHTLCTPLFPFEFIIPTIYFHAHFQFPRAIRVQKFPCERI